MKNTSRFFRIAMLITTLVFAKNANAMIPKNVIVAVIDTGADITHPTIKDHLWKNIGEMGFDKSGKNKSSNKIDDDGNGFIDDVYGWNFASNNNDIKDEHGHGTHISGIISTDRGVKIMVLKAFSPSMTGDEAIQATAQAIGYAIKMKANIINYSGGGPQPSSIEENAIKLAAKHDILFIAAAGNERANSDDIHFYPADYPLSNIISVAAVDLSGTLLPFSNYGRRTVHIAAPGFRILSSLPSNQYGAMTGTSQATALVTRTAALIYEQKNARRSPSSTIQRIISSGDHVQGLEGKLKYPIVLNTVRALQAM